MHGFQAYFLFILCALIFETISIDFHAFLGLYVLEETLAAMIHDSANHTIVLATSRV